MPAWWGRKSHKNTKEANLAKPQLQTQVNSLRNEEITPIKEKARSFDETSIRAACLTGSSSLDSELEKRRLKKGHPLPRPGASTPPSSLLDQTGGAALGSASNSVSSNTSSTSSIEDPSPDFGFASHLRGRSEIKASPGTRSPGPGSRSPRAASPLRSLLLGSINLDSPTANHENGKSLCHPLPLPPPGSPSHQSNSPSTRMTETYQSTSPSTRMMSETYQSTSPSTRTSESYQSTSPSTRTSESNESSSSEFCQSLWKKGKLLGRGTFGHVYVGFNSEKGRMCAIKEVRLVSDDQNSKECLKQLNQEITLLGQLKHPNIVQYYGSELGEDALAVFLEYVTGGSIHKLLQEYGPFREPVIQSYTRQILLGLAYLHGRNTVHRDIKGANILVGPNGEIKLADFGMAKHITSNTSILSFKGSPYWMAPEVIMNISGYNLAVDIWSLGCTILEMATSKPPWSQFEGVAAIFKIGNSKDIPDIPDHLSNDAKCFLNLCLQRDPSARPTALQLLDHPFVREQTAIKVPRMNIHNDSIPPSSEGSQTLSVFDVYSNQTSTTSQEGDFRLRPLLRSPREFRKPMDAMRVNMSLPVSPSSSPLRHYGPAHRSCFLSPPPGYMVARENAYEPTGRSVMSARQYLNYPNNQFGDIILQPKAQTPGVSPRRRPF